MTVVSTIRITPDPATHHVVGGLFRCPECISLGNRLTDLENELMVAEGKDGGRDR